MLKKNDIVDIVSPSTPCTFDEIQKIKNYVKKIGFTPRIFLEKETAIKKSQSHEFASIAAETRFEQLKEAIENPHSKIIWCTRGGYGSAEILPFLMKMKKPKKPKIFIGFSDISSLNIFLIQQWGWKVVSAPMLVQLALEKVSKKSEKAILDLVFGKNKELKYLNLKRGAKGYAVIEGFKEALKGNSNLIGFKDADMASSPEAFYELVKKINNYDGIIASRYVKGSIIAPKPTLERIFASRIFNFMIKIILGLRFKDTQCGAKLFKRKTLEKTIPRLTFSQLAFDVEILYIIKKLGFKTSYSLKTGLQKTVQWYNTFAHLQHKND